jgi:hypothetical protein
MTHDTRDTWVLRDVGASARLRLRDLRGSLPRLVSARCFARVENGCVASSLKKRAEQGLSLTVRAQGGGRCVGVRDDAYKGM